METCKYAIRIYKIILILTILLFVQINLSASTFDDLRKIKKTSYLDFILLKIENRLIQRHRLLGAQPIALRVQYQSIGSQVDFSEEQSKIIISIIGVMDKQRYSQKKYRPKISDCNILRNMLLYGKYGYNVFFQKRNKYLTGTDMEEIFLTRFLKNISLSDKEKTYILDNTIVKSQVIDPVRGNDIFCTGKVAEDLR
mgnify:FL=1|tara:strand:- start:255 stop:845 length:591 start_codon:yes stop_codon:yes gene_type:complete